MHQYWFHGSTIFVLFLSGCLNGRNSLIFFALFPRELHLEERMQRLQFKSLVSICCFFFCCVSISCQRKQGSSSLLCSPLNLWHLPQVKRERDLHWKKTKLLSIQVKACQPTNYILFLSLSLSTPWEKRVTMFFFSRHHKFKKLGRLLWKDGDGAHITWVWSQKIASMGIYFKLGQVTVLQKGFAFQLIFWNSILPS